MKSKYKVGDILQFKFAGAYEIGKITNIEKREKGMVYILSDGKYKYNINDNQIITKVEKPTNEE